MWFSDRFIDRFIWLVVYCCRWCRDSPVSLRLCRAVMTSRVHAGSGAPTDVQRPATSEPPSPTRSYPTPVTSLSAWDTANFVKRSLFTHPRVLRDAGVVWFSYEYQQKFALRGLIFRAFKLSWLFLSWGK